MRGFRKFCQRGSNFDTLFLKLMRGGRIQVPLRCEVFDNILSVNKKLLLKLFGILENIK